MGSPAPAGIDPPACGPSVTSIRLPRTRGDRPPTLIEAGPHALAPPHPRGSTPPAAGRFSAGPGSPAPAGIDPALKSPIYPCFRLPRTRGDRPARQRLGKRTVTAPPHPRGSTPDAIRTALRCRGSPAPAGIDPMPSPRASASCRLPRTRGDRPRLSDARPPVPRAPPHPRGSTLALSAAVHFKEGSPAPAGIDPRRPSPSRPRRRLPRTRGDRPLAGSGQRFTGPAPPHPRGSTLRAARRAIGRCGSPAPAGIDPRSDRAIISGCGLPRTRGDRPKTPPSLVHRAPAPPHPRGSTRRSARSQDLQRGSPAPAGIDPISAPGCSIGAWLPRTRGDRPATVAATGTKLEAPPHPRGSTRTKSCGRCGRAGSPAPAGIDPRRA